MIRPDVEQSPRAPTRSAWQRTRALIGSGSSRRRDSGQEVLLDRLVSRRFIDREEAGPRLARCRECVRHDKQWHVEHEVASSRVPWFVC